MSDNHHERKHSEDRTMEYLGCFYSAASHDFQHGMLPVARTIKAECDDLCVVEIRGGADRGLERRI